ncbi:MAG: hypothetical protein BAJALOKI1v1_610003 [Promethearchaeota archaeon]|nr:MAG: hypothetical protein BAJALOKI1v1_610003 [Candidatus Lokiarchaeota archaeon]
MEQKDKSIEKRSKRIIRLFNAFRGKPISEAPGPIPEFSKWLNGRILNVKRGELELQYDLRPEMANPTGLLHGGMQAALIDDTIGMCTATLGYEGFLITIDAQINFLGKVKVDQSVKVKAMMVREGRNVVHFFCQISDPNEKLIATGNANLLKTKYTPDYVKAVDNGEGFNIPK